MAREEGPAGTSGHGEGAVDPHRTGLSPNAVDALAAIVQSSDDAIYSKDSKAVITSWNPAAERLYGWTAEEAIGRPIRILLPESRHGEEMDILERILGGDRVDHYETERVRKDGTSVYVSVSVSPVHDAEGNVVEAAVVARDITARRELEEVLASENRRQALELNDEVVQGLATAKIALESDRPEHGLRAVAATLVRAKNIVSALLIAANEPIQPGDLIRRDPAALPEDDPAAE